LVTGVSSETCELEIQSPGLLMPIEGGVARVQVGKLEDNLDRSSFLVLPAASVVRIDAVTTGLRVAAVAFHPPLFERVETTYHSLGLDGTLFETLLASATILPRTVWIHEVVHRYIFERDVLGAPDNIATDFLETEILKEIYYLFRDRAQGYERASIQHQYCEAVEKAVAYLEEHLFESPSVPALAKAAAVSESTLLRSFRRDLGITPAAYWRGRKLDSALDMLRTGRFTVAEVAEKVGYEDATAFGNAFRLRFGKAPSTYRPSAKHRSAP
jgi:AraC-like DNA-binding protein